MYVCMYVCIYIYPFDTSIPVVLPTWLGSGYEANSGHPGAPMGQAPIGSWDFHEDFRAGLRVQGLGFRVWGGW